MDTESASLVAVGDIMLGDHPICVGHGVGSILKTKNSDFLFNNVSEILNAADITFGNLECVLSDIDIQKNHFSSVSLRGNEKSIIELKNAGFNVLSIANNHSLEHGTNSLNRTKELLSQNGIQGIGVSETATKSREIYLREVNGIKFGFLAYCLIDDKTAYCSTNSNDEIVNDVKKLNSEVDILIVSLHWGNEFIRKPSQAQVELGHKIVDAGAKLILGHHPHVLQGVEQYNDGVIVYSMGNFVFDMWQKKMRESMIFSCNFSKKGILNFDISPVIIGKDFKPYLLDGIKKEKLKSKIINEFLECLDTKSYNRELISCKKQYRFDLIIHLIFNCYKYNPRYACQILLTSLKKRLVLK